ncbi:putative PurR-regulated permease PerM [Ilumatobacter fluminis]|uniref:Putative PurR-regulated permease PerM n=1 Tax=Ilumatobacter fluminis TaxID=467091 RepID=A0A4R7I5Y1_9ACTN|nr:AI-2E family transporter [Ilumatobacter fluminis]TDT18113.1 putative PurR-regulated permease PerM [Ilumatobacter fluminis]
MTTDDRPASSIPPREHPTRERVREWGSTAWRYVGILLAVSMTYTLVVAFSGLVVPLVLAAVVGTLCAPLVARLERHRVPRQVAALGLIAALLVLGFVALFVTVNGVVDEAIEIRAVMSDGVDQIDSWLPDGGFTSDAGALVDEVEDQGRPIFAGAASWATTIFSSAVAFGIGAFLALFMVYYILVDWTTVRGWLARHLGVSEPMGVLIIDDAVSVVRRGFGALTVTSVIITAVIGSAMVLLGLPLVASAVVVTFLMSYVPYLGAIVSGGFVLLIALGSGSTADVWIMLAVVLIAQNIIQTLVGNRLTSDRLKLHPLSSIVSSVTGVAIAGLLGAMLSAPALALGMAVAKRLRDPEMVLGEGVDPPVS